MAGKEITNASRANRRERGCVNQKVEYPKIHNVSDFVIKRWLAHLQCPMRRSDQSVHSRYARKPGRVVEESSCR